MNSKLVRPVGLPVSAAAPVAAAAPAAALVAAIIVALLAGSMATLPIAASASAQATRSLIVVGDSIVLAASEELVASAPSEWNVQIDAEVSRPTNVGHDIVRGNLAAITDTLVIGLGANDAASPEIFRKRASALLADVAAVPHVFWIEIAEVRDYYPGANATIRDLAAGYPNVSIVPWTGLATGTPGLTASDGLHLTGPGQQALADSILSLVVQTTPPASTPIADLEPSSANQDVVPTAPIVPVIEAARLRLILSPLLAALGRLQSMVSYTVLFQ